jgi:hypothetical protein
MNYLLSGSLLFLLLGCSPLHKHMQAVNGSAATLQQFKPSFKVALYNTKVDVVGNHLSGLLLIKKMPDSSTRMVFSNEMGFKFFDFEFAADGSFKVFSVVKQMNRKAVLKTLRKDFELVLMNKLDSASMEIKKEGALIYYIFPQTKGFNYYITDSTGNELIKMERASKRKVVVEAIAKNYVDGVPDSIAIAHKTFNFTIDLKRIKQ